MKIKENWTGIRQLGLESPGAIALTKRVTDGVASDAGARAGWDWGPGRGDDNSGRMRREDDPTPNRARSAVLAQHPNPAARAKGREALRASM